MNFLNCLLSDENNIVLLFILIDKLSVALRMISNPFFSTAFHIDINTIKDIQKNKITDNIFELVKTH